LSYVNRNILTCKTFLNQASEAVEDGDAALLKRDFRNAVKCYLRAMRLDKSLFSKEMSMVETPIDAINNLILLEKRDVFQSPVCFDIIEALQDRSYLKPILLKKNTMKRSTARRIVNMVGQLHCISVIRSGNSLLD
jgi:hypothetical protein